MDNIDKQILSALQKNATIPLSELSKKVGLSTTPCWNRIRKMEEEGTIKSRVTVLNNKKINLNIVIFLSISVSSHSEEWLTAFKKVRRMASSKKSDSFMGSDLSYEDMTSRELSENTYNRLEDDVVDGRECYVLEIIPSEKLNSSYSKHISWVIKDGLLGLKEESYDKRGELKKKKEFQYKRLKDYHVIERIYVKDMQKNHTTEIMFKSIEVDSGIGKNLFQEKKSKATS